MNTKRIRRIVGIAGVGLSLTLGGPALAQAIWDIGLYDECMKVATTVEQKDRCCLGSGGQFGIGMHSDGSIRCVAPAAESDNAPGNGGPPPGRPRPPLSDGSVGVADQPAPGTPLPTTTPPPRPVTAPITGVG
ncbi:hypothetical protein SAMN04489835_3814 [Mycolicibacterium rutilum]|uniref:Uncharacterized protein n=1 Tax=Mycolicibacterium rutilum TaxID=370526 RepID=A0A1H6KLQ8_MYCRU|nr:hypothetical protein [Mycolicibacterium rutilum]SEH76417.1 hypothetical protein SAMN04489835_3814 [Mycolicibacterium rutilum]